jgi:hypothetical protein
LYYEKKSAHGTVKQQHQNIYIHMNVHFPIPLGVGLGHPHYVIWLKVFLSFQRGRARAEG